MVNIDLNEALPILLYIGLIVLVICLIVFVIRLTKTLAKVDSILDDANSKMNKVDGLFDIIDRTTDFAASISDRMISKITDGISRLFNRGRDLDE